MARRCFFSFHYDEDCHRAYQVREIGSIEGNQAASDNDWEQVINGGDDAIKQWINDQMFGRSCAVVLVGAATAKRKWINYEIVRAWDEGLGLVGIHVHGLKNLSGEATSKGANPFACVNHGPTRKPLSSIVKCYDPAGATSKERYAWIAKHLENAIEEAVKIRGQNY
jgi:hypothetical protein